MRKTIYMVNETKGGSCANIFVEYGKGDSLALEDMVNVFGEDEGFTKALEKELEANAPLYVDDRGDILQVITIPTLIEAVYGAEDPLERATLYNTLMEIEKALVNIWG